MKRQIWTKPHKLRRIIERKINLTNKNREKNNTTKQNNTKRSPTTKE